MTSKGVQQAISTPRRCPHVRAIALADRSAAEVEDILQNADAVAAAEAISGDFSE